MRYVFNAIQEVGTFSQCEPLITVTAIKKKHWNYDEFIMKFNEELSYSNYSSVKPIYNILIREDKLNNRNLKKLKSIRNKINDYNVMNYPSTPIKLR